MFQFRRFPTYAYLIQRRLTEYCSAGFPHSEISGSTVICTSPKLIAACHVLHRLLMPRHSPCALISLTFRRTVSGSTFDHELCRLHRSFANWLIVFTQSLERLSPFYLKVPQHCCFCPLLLASHTLNLHCSVFKVQPSNLFQGQIETLNA